MSTYVIKKQPLKAVKLEPIAMRPPIMASPLQSTKTVMVDPRKLLRRG